MGRPQPRMHWRLRNRSYRIADSAAAAT
jgi:hypothetical protein